VRIEESGNPGSGARCLFIEAHPDQRATEQADHREHPGSAASLPAAPANVASMPGWLFMKE
jgi:hypothetical protein